MSIFPKTFLPKSRTLVTLAMAGAVGLGEHQYQFDPVSKRWTQVSYRYIGWKRK